MDSFTENILTRARERQRILRNITQDDKNEVSTEKFNARTIGTPEKDMKSSHSDYVLPKSKSTLLNMQSPKRVYDGTLSGFPHTKTLNIQEENLSMEIKVTSSDSITVQVEVDKEANSEQEKNGLRKSAKDRLNRLGRLYRGDETVISSPIHKTEEIAVSGCSGNKIIGKGLKKLANLAKEMNHWEDDIKPKMKNQEKTNTKPNLNQCNNDIKMLDDKKEANVVDNTNKNVFKMQCEQTEIKSQSEVLKLDKSVLDTLESQGFQRVSKHTNGKLTYDFNGGAGNEKTSINKCKNVEKGERKENLSPKKIQIKQLAQGGTNQSIVNKAARFESTYSRTASPDPSLLSISEKKALFEKNLNEPLIPKAPFGSSIPCVDGKSRLNSHKPSKTVETTSVPLKSESQQCFKRNSSNTDSSSSKPIPSATSSKEKDETPDSQSIGKSHEIKYSVQELGNIPEIEEEDNTVTTNCQICIMPEERPSPLHKNGTKRSSVSPKVAAVLKDVKKVKVSPAKPGQLYPNLSDIETDTEDQTQPPSLNSTLDSTSRDDINTSFGREIMDAVCRSQAPLKRFSCSETQSDVSDILDDMDDYLSESLNSNEEKHSLGPTPPKLTCKDGHTRPSHSFHYKKILPSVSDNFKSPLTFTGENSGKSEFSLHVVDSEVPLTHTVSFYRKQTSNSAMTTPTKRVVHEDEILPKEDNSVIILKKIKMLQDEINKQQLIISQTSRALNLCNSTLEFMGSTEQVEAEKLLLLATQRRQAMLNEIQRLQVEGTLRPQSRHAKDLPLEKGTLTISNINLPLKKEYVRALAAAGGKGHHVTCLVKCGEEVVCSKVISTVATDIKNPCCELSIPESLTLNNIYSDFAITFEIYCLQAQEEILPHDVKYHIKKDSKLTPKKSKQNSLLSRPVKESPAGPMSVRSPSFALMGYVVLSIQQMNKKTWKLNNTPTKSPLEGSVDMCVSCELTASVEHRGFLTMFADISGFGAWHRRWFVLKENSLSYWKYPDDEKKVPPIDSIDLNNCINKEVGPVSRDICARLHTFLLETVREPLPQDKDSLITICKQDRTIIRHLLSADIKEERIVWCSKINSALTALKLWGKNRV